METAPEISEGIAAGLGVGYAIILLAGVGLLICGIMVGVKILKREGAGLGVLAIVLAIFCGLATLIW
ncbi:MAG: hypothetical protein P8J87_18175, partial [Verrucomicrobiales bacterium]|nr:hypothetical protein [Verrucomicrobiales bacterium]